MTEDTGETFKALLARQEQLEQASMAEGVERFRSRVLAAQHIGRGSQVGAARKLLSAGVEPLATAFETLLEDGKARPGRRHYVEKWITLVGCEPLAYLTVRTVLDLMVKQTTVRKVALSITEKLVDELRYRRFQEQAPQLFDYRMAKFTTSNYAHMARSLDAAMKYAEIDTSDLEMTQQVRLVVGIKLVDMLVAATQLVELRSVVTSKGGHGRKHISRETLMVPTPETLQWLHTRNGGLEALQPLYRPMLVPPVAWTPGKRGGYRFAQRGQRSLVRGVSKEHAQTLKTADMPVVYEALNAIQETAWKINPHVLRLVQQITATGRSIAGVPSFVDGVLPPKPANIDQDKETRRLWRRAAHKIKEANHERKLKAMEFDKVFATATAFKDEAAIYFPSNVDFRGRVYPVSNYLNPQGDDLSKALLTFAEGKPLGDAGAVWLALHGANCLGTTPDGLKLSRCTLQERVDWIVAHTNDLEAVAADPLSLSWWHGVDVDEPLQFFAFCVEWAGYAKAQRAGALESWCCSLPCAMDGTCNGLQHFAALLLDSVGGAAVNVVPSERPNDIYQRVADAVARSLESAASSDALARLWLVSGLLDRKLTKRPTMTFGYGSKRYGFQQQLVEYIKGHDRWQELRPLFIDAEGKQDALLQPACGYMAGLIWNALQSTVIAASLGMQWLQDAARCVVRTGQCVEWAVPGTGFLVKQEYMQFTSRQIETVLSGRMYKPSLHTQTDHPDLIKQSNAMAPNFVHSMDAATLMLTVVDAKAAGVSSFGMVHDSYATHAGDCEALAKSTRSQFVRLYSETDVIGELSDRLREQAGPIDTFPVQPLKGSLKLTDVNQSLYFFS